MNNKENNENMLKKREESLSNDMSAKNDAEVTSSDVSEKEGNESDVEEAPDKIIDTNMDSSVDAIDSDNKDESKIIEIKTGAIDINYEDIKSFILKNKLIVSLLSLSVLLNIVQVVFIENNKNQHKNYIVTLNDTINTLDLSIKEKDEKIQSLTDIISENRDEINELSEKVKLSEPWLRLSNEQREVIQVEINTLKAKEQAELEAKIQAQKEEEAKKAEEERKAKEKAEKEKYNTGITYNQLARNPEEYKYKLCKFKGKVLQVMEGGEVNQLRLAVNGDYNSVLYVEYDPSSLNSRILENDTITVYGMSFGIYSYTSVLGSNISVPAVIASKVDI